MSTRANIIIKDSYSELIFYRHSDGYPEGTLPTLEKLLDWVKEGRIRNNVGQAAGWLIVIGREEYEEYHSSHFEPGDKENNYGMGWKVGAYEPSIGIHGDIDYLYVIDLEAKTIDAHGRADFAKYQGKFADAVEV